MYVNSMSQINLDKLNSSSFKLAKQKEPVKLLASFIKSVNQGNNPGALLVVIKPFKGSLNYQIDKDPITEKKEWETNGDTRTKFEFANLEQGQKYWTRVIAIDSDGQTVQSMEVAE